MVQVPMEVRVLSMSVNPKTLTVALVCMLLVLSSCKDRTRQPVVAQPAARPTPVPAETFVGQPEPDEPILQETDDASDGALLGSRRTEMKDDDERNPLRKIHFEYDKDRITDEAKAALSANAAYLKQNSYTYIRIEGHCDERGSIEYNQALGDRRANAAKKYLSALGVDPVRVDSISFGEDRPVSFDQNEYAWAQNRRAEFRILSE